MGGTLLIDGFPYIDYSETVNGLHAGVGNISALRAVTQHYQYDIIGVQSPAPGGMYMFNATSTAADDGSSTIKPDDIGVLDPGRWIKMGSGTGGTPTTDTTEESFLFNSASPHFVRNMLAGQTVISAEIQIVTPFDDPAATLQLGTPATPGLIIPSAKNDPTSVGVYRSDSNFQFPAGGTVQLTISPGISTQGTGFIILQSKV